MSKKLNEINCPFCKDVIGSDIAETKKAVNGQWQCDNGHTFLLQYLFTFKNGKEIIES